MVSLATLLTLATLPAHAWIFPEHRDITALAINGLDPGHRATLDKLWVAGRAGRESRLGPLVAETFDGTIDYAAWPAIAGDHSCSAPEMLATILESGWIVDVSGIASHLKDDLSRKELRRHERINALRQSDLDFLRADPGYASRAGANNVHFLLARSVGDGTADAGSYVDVCLSPGAPLNAIGAYGWHHRQALAKARRLATETLPDSERAELTLSALADEAYAIHFLQDVFAAGHVAGTRGDAALRKGTHDYYNEHGLETRNWDNRTMILKGDAWMRPADAERAAAAVRASLGQFIDAAAGAERIGRVSDRATGAFTLQSCEDSVMPALDGPADVRSDLVDILRSTPMPGLGEGDGELPRFRGDLGAFLGIVPGVRAAASGGSFGAGQDQNGWGGGLDIGVRFGLGLDGVLGESGDGLVFLDLGFRQDAASSTAIVRDPVLEEFGQIFSAVPARAAFTARLRLPFWLLPLDLVAAAPFLLPFDKESYSTMAIIASNGGLVPWQSAIATSFGRFQFVLGREIGASFYGYVRSADRLLLPYGDPAAPDLALVDMRSVGLEFPVVEYRPFRTFSLDEASSLVLQLYTAVDIPTKVSVIAPADIAPPESNPIWHVGLRAAFAWRHYW
jgi:hypothetical protein